MYTTNLTKMIDNLFPTADMTNYRLWWPGDVSHFSHEEVTSEKDGSTKITILVPGLSKEDFDLQVTQDGSLHLSTKKDITKVINRTWRLSDRADVKSISAECKNGVFTMHVPVKAKLDKSRQIDIK